MFLYRLFSERPHIAGSTREKDLAEQLKSKWQNYNFRVEMAKYKVLVSLPKSSSLNKVQLVDIDDKVQFTSKEDNIVSLLKTVHLQGRIQKFRRGGRTHTD